MFDDKELQMMISLDLMFIEFLDPVVAQLERHITQRARSHNHLDYQLLRSIPGVGEILSLIILYETHDIKRFKTLITSRLGLPFLSWQRCFVPVHPKNWWRTFLSVARLYRWRLSISCSLR